MKFLRRKTIPGVCDDLDRWVTTVESNVHSQESKQIETSPVGQRCVINVRACEFVCKCNICACVCVCMHVCVCVCPQTTLS